MKKNVSAIRRTRADKAFDLMDYIFLTVAFLLVAYPLYFVVIASVSDPIAVYEGRVIFYPIKPTLEGYRRILSYSTLFTGYKNTLLYTLVGTSINVVLTITAGYALSRKELVGRNIMMMGVMITMIVSATRRDLIEAAYTLGCQDTAAIRRVVLPGAAPEIAEALRQVLGLGWTYIIVAELIGASSGIGHMITDSQALMATDNIIAGIVIIGLVGLISDLAFKKVNQRLFAWSLQR